MNNQFTTFQYTAPQVPQPQGIVYSVNSAAELNAIPLNTNVCVAFCFPEDLCYIRTIQNNAPVVTTYKLTPYTGDKPEDPILETLKSLDQRLKALENKNKRGGSLDELL